MRTKSKKYHLTNKEYEIMKILWDSGKPMLVSDILLETDNVAENSLHPMIKNLIDNGFIKVVGNMRVSKTTSRLYAPAITVDEYAAMQLEGIMKTSNSKLDFKNILAFFTSRNKKNNKDVIEGVKEFIKKYEEDENL